METLVMGAQSRLAHLKVNFFRYVKHISNGTLDSYYHSPVMDPIRAVTACAAPRNYTMLRKWLNNCMKTHKKCCPLEQCSVSDPACESVALPIRLVDAGSEEICPFLAETKGKRGFYLTLSHRWGKRQKTRNYSR